MKPFMYLSVIAALVFITSGCANTQNKTGEGAVVGGLLGAAAGGIIGHQSGEAATGVLIGGAVGAASGAVIGSQIPKEEEPTYVNRPIQPINQVTMQQIVDWTKQGLPSDEIIDRIRKTNSSYSLTPEDVGYLRTSGVSQRVIETMQAAK